MRYNRNLAFKNNPSQFPERLGLSGITCALGLLPLGYSFFTTVLERRQPPQTSIQDLQDRLLVEEGDISVDGNQILASTADDETETFTM